MSVELNGTSRTPPSPTPRALAASHFRRPRLVAPAFGRVLLATVCIAVFSARNESHFQVLLRRGRLDPIVSPHPPSAMDFTRPGITEEELNSEVELLRDEDLLKQVVTTAGLVPGSTPDSERSARIEHAVRQLAQHLDVEAHALCSSITANSTIAKPSTFPTEPRWHPGVSLSNWASGLSSRATTSFSWADFRRKKTATS